MRTFLSLLFALSLLALLTGASGCTLIGYAIGSGVDASNTSIVEFSPAMAIDRLEAAQPVTVIMNDGTRRWGSYAGIGMPSREVLLERLPAEPDAGCAERATVRFGDEIVLHRTGLPPEPVRYLGTAAQRLWYAPLDRSEVRVQLFREITELTRCGGRALRPPFQESVDGGVFESSNCLRLTSPDSMQYVDLAEITAISFLYQRTSRRISYTAIGAVADIAIIMGAALSSGAGSGGGGADFRPLISILNGQK